MIFSNKTVTHYLLQFYFCLFVFIIKQKIEQKLLHDEHCKINLLHPVHIHNILYIYVLCKTILF